MSRLPSHLHKHYFGKEPLDSFHSLVVIIFGRARIRGFNFFVKMDPTHSPHLFIIDFFDVTIVEKSGDDIVKVVISKPVEPPGAWQIFELINSDYREIDQDLI